MYDTTVVYLNDERQRCSIGRFTEPKVEPEVIFHFSSVPPYGGSLAEMVDCIDWRTQPIDGLWFAHQQASMQR
jgi:2-oxo-3-hexenedioate decarboxylase